MKIDQLIVAIYLLFGIFFGYVSNYFNRTLSNLTLALVVPIMACIISQAALLTLVKQKKRSWLISNSLVTFVFVWMLVWILAHNL